MRKHFTQVKVLCALQNCFTLEYGLEITLFCHKKVCINGYNMILYLKMDKLWAYNAENCNKRLLKKERGSIVPKSFVTTLRFIYGQSYELISIKQVKTQLDLIKSIVMDWKSYFHKFVRLTYQKDFPEKQEG